MNLQNVGKYGVLYADATAHGGSSMERAMRLNLVSLGCALLTVGLEVAGLNYFGAIEHLGPQAAEVKFAAVPRAPHASPWLLRTDEFAAVIRGDHGAGFRCGALCGTLDSIDQNAPVDFYYPSLRNPKEKLLI